MSLTFGIRLFISVCRRLVPSKNICTISLAIATSIAAVVLVTNTRMDRQYRMKRKPGHSIMIVALGIRSSTVDSMFGPMHEGGVRCERCSRISCVTMGSHELPFPVFLIKCGVNFCHCAEDKYRE
jgi:hypothetical protein